MQLDVQSAHSNKEEQYIFCLASCSEDVDHWLLLQHTHAEILCGFKEIEKTLNKELNEG